MTFLSNHRRGLSLLEVILAIAILGVALATIGQLVRLGSRNAAAARDLMTAQIHCESKLNEVAAGAADMNAVSDAPLDEYGEWVYSVESTPIDDAGMIEIKVTVSQAADAAARPINYTLTRWLIDPAVIEAAEAEAAAMQEQAAAAAAQGEQNAAEGAGTPDANAGGNAGGNNNSGTPGGGQGQPGGPGIPGAPGGFGPGGPGGPGPGGDGDGRPRGGRGGRDRGNGAQGPGGPGGGRGP